MEIVVRRRLSYQDIPTVLTVESFFRRLWFMGQTVPPFLVAALSSKGLITKEGRQLIRGKARRIFLSMIPPLSRHLQRKYGLQGSCSNCGASCKLLFQCPHWDKNTRLCSIYEDRPNICRLFPITPADIRDRHIAAERKTECGFDFKPTKV